MDGIVTFLDIEPPRDYIKNRSTEDPASGCWNWDLKLTTAGYGHARRGNSRANTFSRTMAHRYAYEAFIGPIPPGMTVDHLCRNRRCVNPAHLEACSIQVNILRGDSPSAVAHRRGTCKRGHPFSGTRQRKSRPGTYQFCTACHNIRHGKTKG